MYLLGRPNTFFAAKVHVIFSGECAIYTMRELDKATASILKTGELKAKFVGMQRRVSVAVRSDSVVLGRKGSMVNAEAPLGEKQIRSFRGVT